MRTMARAAVLLLVVAFMAGVWDARNEDERRPARSTAPFWTDPVERSRRAGRRRSWSRSRPRNARGTTGCCSPSRGRCRATRSATWPGSRTPRRRLALRGQAFVAVAFEPARAHDPDGRRPSRRHPHPRRPALRQVRFAGDFEGQVSFGLGVSDRGGFRVSELRNPTRVAVDVR